MIDEHLRDLLSEEKDSGKRYSVLLQWRTSAPPELVSARTPGARRAALSAWQERLQAPLRDSLRSHGLELRELRGGGAILTASVEQLRELVSEGVLDDERLKTRVNEIVAYTR